MAQRRFLCRAAGLTAACGGLENRISWLIQNTLGEYLIWPASTLESSGNIWKVLLAEWACAAPSLVTRVTGLKQRKKQRTKKEASNKETEEEKKWTKKNRKKGTNEGRSEEPLQRNKRKNKKRSYYRKMSTNMEDANTASRKQGKKSLTS